MIKNDYCYAEICTTPFDRGNIREVVDVPDMFNAKPMECYTSIYRYPADILPHVEKNKSVTGYDGPVRATGLHFDFDSSIEDLVLRETRKFCEDICSKPEYAVNCDDISVWFSGNKGFHVLIANKETLGLEPCSDIPDKIKAVCMALAGSLTSFDRSVYDRPRIFRVSNSRHKKSRLYKIPLFMQELWEMEMDDIRVMAKTQRTLKDMETIRESFKKRGVYGPV